MPSSKTEQPDINWTALSEEDAELFESLQSAVSALGDEADHPMIEVRDKLAVAFRDKAALLKRNWTDEMFQEGQHLNEEKVAEIEAAMATDLGSFGGGLQNGQNLGNALDLVGAYMKNYKLDKADAVLAKCGPFVSHRGGVWMVKWLNHVQGLRVAACCSIAVQDVVSFLSSSWPEVSTVRMKQSRHLEALAPWPSWEPAGQRIVARAYRIQCELSMQASQSKEMLYDLEMYSESLSSISFHVAIRACEHQMEVLVQVS